MNGFLEFHMARSNIEMQRKRNRDGVLNSYYEIRKSKTPGSAGSFSVHREKEKSVSRKNL